jgi:hypothetical protein
MGYSKDTVIYNKILENQMNKPVINPLPQKLNSKTDESIVISRYTERDRIPINRNIRRVYHSYRKHISDVIKTDEWKGKRCFILGGGESMKGFDYSRLDGELTIGVNRNFQFYNPTLFYSMDTRFHGWVKGGVLDKYDCSDAEEQWRNLKSHKIFLCPLSEYDFGDDNVYVVNRILDKVVSRDLQYGIFGGNNSGFGAIMLAITLGADPIYIMGFDMKAKNKTHFHSGYPNQQIENLRIKLESYRLLIESVAPVIRNMDFRVINLNPDSALTCFEFNTISNVLNNKED